MLQCTELECKSALSDTVLSYYHTTLLIHYHIQLFVPKTVINFSFIVSEELMQHSNKL